MIKSSTARTSLSGKIVPGHHRLMTVTLRLPVEGGGRLGVLTMSNLVAAGVVLVIGREGASETGEKGLLGTGRGPGVVEVALNGPGPGKGS